jgi:hypothetical protein
MNSSRPDVTIEAWAQKGIMQPVIIRREESTDHHRQVRFLFDGRTIVTLNQLKGKQDGFEQGHTEIYWTVASGKSADFATALGTALLEAAAIARVWDANAEGSQGITLRNKPVTGGMC